MRWQTLFGVEFGELGEVADFHALGEFDGAFGGGFAAADEVEEGGFAGAVAADEADALAGLDGEVELAQGPELPDLRPPPEEQAAQAEAALTAAASGSSSGRDSTAV